MPDDLDVISATTVLPDGTELALVTMRPEDAERLVRFHHRLCPETTYLRFFFFHPELGVEELHRFTHLDHREREAIVATHEGEIVGVARFDRFGDGSCAEVAFVVADSFQGRGLGSELLRHLARRGRQVGVTRFVADTLPHNGRMLSVLRCAGLPTSETSVDGVVRVTLDLGSER
jgi:RimJ/RimL family protein N-acetyltransferase